MKMMKMMMTRRRRRRTTTTSKWDFGVTLISYWAGVGFSNVAAMADRKRCENGFTVAAGYATMLFKKGLHMWKPIEEEVRAWVHANFARWESEKPEWWTKKLIQKIPEQVLSKDEMTALLSGGKKSRKSSILQEAGIVD